MARYLYVTCNFDPSKIESFDPDLGRGGISIALLGKINRLPNIFPTTPWFGTDKWEKEGVPEFSCRIWDGRLEDLKALPWIVSASISEKPLRSTLGELK